LRLQSVSGMTPLVQAAHESGDLLANPVNLHSSGVQQTCRQAVRVDQNAQQQVLRSDVTVSETVRYRCSVSIAVPPSELAS
jgi:hypothetical protein